ncbi:hypothetical protein [Streptomyces sp. NPDC058045]|uniref:hypothetical protein n=1 Tax=Streptomyces sp. NPDC058045 TaxID=3346311 RepID=UPI0036E36B58
MEGDDYEPFPAVVGALEALDQRGTLRAAASRAKIAGTGQRITHTCARGVTVAEVRDQLLAAPRAGAGIPGDAPKSGFGGTGRGGILAVKVERCHRGAVTARFLTED